MVYPMVKKTTTKESKGEDKEPNSTNPEDLPKYV